MLSVLLRGRYFHRRWVRCRLECQEEGDSLDGFSALIWYVLVLLLVLQALASVRPPEEKKVEKGEEEEVKPPSPTRPKVETTEVSGGCRLVLPVVAGHQENLRGVWCGRLCEVERWRVKCVHCATAAASMGSRGLSLSCNPCSPWYFDPFAGISVC